jgi:hypothetical protein
MAYWGPKFFLLAEGIHMPNLVPLGIIDHLNVDQSTPLNS